MKLYKILSPASKVPKEHFFSCEVGLCFKRLNSGLCQRKEEDLKRIVGVNAIVLHT